MDESTSAMDVPLERRCLQRCIDRGISFISVGHRPTLLPLLTHLLVLDHGGRYVVRPVTADDGPLDTDGDGGPLPHDVPLGSPAGRVATRSRFSDGVAPSRLPTVPKGASLSPRPVKTAAASTDPLRQGLLSGDERWDVEAGAAVDESDTSGGRHDSGVGNGGGGSVDGEHALPTEEEEAAWAEEEWRREENPWDSAQLRYQQPDGSVALDWDVLKKLTHAFLRGRCTALAVQV